MTERECPHCNGKGRVHKRGVSLTWVWRGIHFYDYDNIDTGPCQKCGGTGLSSNVSADITRTT